MLHFWIIIIPARTIFRNIHIIYFRCILASQCNQETTTPCKNGNGVRSDTNVNVDLRDDDNYVCCSAKEVLQEDPLECYDIPNHE